MLLSLDPLSASCATWSTAARHYLCRALVCFNSFYLRNKLSLEFTQRLIIFAEKLQQLDLFFLLCMS